jgi:hypothetical protein
VVTDLSSERWWRARVPVLRFETCVRDGWIEIRPVMSRLRPATLFEHQPGTFDTAGSLDTPAARDDAHEPGASGGELL